MYLFYAMNQDSIKHNETMLCCFEINRYMFHPLKHTDNDMLQHVLIIYSIN